MQKGPSRFEDWLPCWRLLKTVLIMLALVSLGALKAYERLIVTWAHRYGRKAWALLYQADGRKRKTRMVRIRRRGAAEAEKAKEEGKKLQKTRKVTKETSILSLKTKDGQIHHALHYRYKTKKGLL